MPVVPEPTRAPSPPPHPTRTIFVLYLVLGGALVAIGTAMAALGVEVPLATAFGLGGVLLTVLGAYGSGVGRGAQLLNTALNRIGMGRFREAEALLDEADKTWLGHNRALVPIFRASIAMRRGDMKAALDLADKAVAARTPLRGKLLASIHRSHAIALRSLLRASLGDDAGAKADIAAIAASPDATPQASARAALAEAVLLQRSGDKEALRAHLAKHRVLLSEAAEPRERAIVRAYQRMLRTTATTPYRKKLTDKPMEGEEPALEDWIARVDPAAAPYMRVRAATDEGGEAPAPPLATAEAKALVRRAHAEASAGARATRMGAILKRAALAVVAIGVAGAGIAALDPFKVMPRNGLDSAAPMPSSLIMIVAFVTASVLVVTSRVSAARQTKRLLAALAKVAKGAGGLDDLRALTESSFGVIAAQAHLQLAFHSEKQGDLDAAMREVERGIGRVSARGARMVAADVLLPELRAERAFLLAARDRSEEAAAELDAVSPAAPFLARARFRVALITAIRGGDLAGAARLASSRAEHLPIFARDELCADAARAAYKPELVGAAELARIKDELTFPVTRAWMLAIAPGVVEALERAPEVDEDAGGEAAAEAEAMADEEASNEPENFLDRRS